MPRISQQQKEVNRERILAAAGEGFRARGFDGIGLDEIMRTAGMTHGGFYNHFASKEHLALEVLRRGFADSLAAVAAIGEEHQNSPHGGLQAVVDTYLAEGHRDHPESGCASAALAVDAARDGPEAQAAYLRGLDGYLDAISDALRAAAEQAGVALRPAEAREQAIVLFSRMVGAQVISRAIVRANRTVANEFLRTNRSI